jgi:hypothetical protein
MAVISGTVSGNAQPANVGTGYFMWDMPTFACGGVPQPLVYDDSLVAQGLGAGRWVAVKAGSITGYAGMDVTPPVGFDVYSVSRENVNFSGTTFDCVVVTLVAQ